MLLELGDEGLTGFPAFLVVLTEDAGRLCQQSTFPRLYPAGMELSNRAAKWATVSSPLIGSRATLALNAALCFLRPCYTPRLYFTVHLILDAGLSLSHLSEFPDPTDQIAGLYNGAIGGPVSGAIFGSYIGGISVAIGLMIGGVLSE